MTIGFGQRHRNGRGRNRRFNQFNNQYKTLSQCIIGDKVIVRSLKMNSNKARRLMDMGLLPGTIVEISRIAPFGDPVAIKIRGYQMSFRRREAEQIFVEYL